MWKPTHFPVLITNNNNKKMTATLLWDLQTVTSSFLSCFGTYIPIFVMDNVHISFIMFIFWNFIYVEIMSWASLLKIGSVKTHSQSIPVRCICMCRRTKLMWCKWRQFPSIVENIVGYGENVVWHNFFTSLLSPCPSNSVLFGKVFKRRSTAVKVFFFYSSRHVMF